jgi:DUF4097 and DUF4098 domain-containing protein YvlB
MFRRELNALSLVLALSVAVGRARAQARAERPPEDCRAGEGQVDRFYCETRDFAVPLTKALRVSAPMNGSIRIYGWERNEIRVSARVVANAPSDEEAQDIAKTVATFMSNDELRAEGASLSHRRSWSVGYEVWVPRQTNLELTAHNGGIAVENVDARVNAETTNGSLSMTDLAGDVRGRTANGAVHVEVDGDAWQGRGLDLRTVNGAVVLTVPHTYSAEVEIGTSTITLGRGGPLLRVLTTNGSASIRER